MLVKRSQQFLYAIFAVFLLMAAAVAAPDLRVSHQFLPADASRDYMDVGGVWNGTAEVDGDGFRTVLQNIGTDPAFDVRASVTLPEGFEYVAGSASAGAVALNTTYDAGTRTLTFNLGGAGGHDLAAGQSLPISYRLLAAAGTETGTSSIDHRATSSVVKGDLTPVSAPLSRQNIMVVAGQTTLQVTPRLQSRAVGETATFNIRLVNTSGGGVFNVSIDQSTINPGGLLDLIGIVKVSPARPAQFNAANDIITIDYLGAGEVFEINVEALVTGCGNIVNIVRATDRFGNVVTEAPVQLNLQQPLLQFDIPAIQLNYNAQKEVKIDVTNLRHGAATGVILKTTLNELPVSVGNVRGGWTYNATSGTFTLSSNAGVINDSGSSEIIFDIKLNDDCGSFEGATILYEANYFNTCGDAYTIPKNIGAIYPPTDVPTLSLGKSVSSDRISAGNSGTYTVTLSASHIANIDNDPVVVIDTLPAGVQILEPVTVTNGLMPVINGNEIRWTIPYAQLQASQQMTVEFEVLRDPCLGGNEMIGTAQIASGVTSTANCALSASASARFFVSNNPYLFSHQDLNINGATPGYVFETGKPAVSLQGEGEHIPFEATYEFGIGYPGSWVGSTYSDNFAALASQRLVPGSLEYRFEDAEGNVSSGQVPQSAITSGTPDGATGFTVNLSAFLSATASGTKLKLNYKTTVGDADVGATPRQVLQRTELRLKEGSGDGVCNQTVVDGSVYRFSQGVYYSVGRAAADLTLSMLGTKAPNILEVCQETTLQINLNNLNRTDIHDALIAVESAGTDYDIVWPQTPQYDGTVFNAGNTTFNHAQGTFTYHGGEVVGNGWIRLKVIRRTANMATAGLPVRLSYNSHETADTSPRVYPGSGQGVYTYRPITIHDARLAMRITPGTLAVVGDSVRYTVYLTNTNAGTAYNTKLTYKLPFGLQADKTAMDAANPMPVTLSGQDMEWAVGNIAAGETVEILVVTKLLPGSMCSINVGSDQVTATWGCDGTSIVVGSNPPEYFFPASRMQVVHDTRNSLASLCGLGSVGIIVRNTGATEIPFVTLNEYIPADSGIQIVPGSVRYSINNGPMQALGAAGNPVIVGSEAANTYRWTASEIPALALLSPNGVSGGVQEVRVEFDITATEDLATRNPSLRASVDATLACGSSVSSRGEPFNLPVTRPSLRLTKTGLNVDSGVSYGSTVYGGGGDTVEWTLTVKNEGTEAARNVRLKNPLSTSNSSSTFVRGPGIVGSVPYNAGDWIAIGNAGGTIEIGEELVYVFTEVLGTNCVTETIESEVTWGCVTPPPNTRAGVSAPGTPKASATLVMNPVIQGDLIKQEIVVDNFGGAQVDVTLTNRGGNATALTITNIFADRIVLDQSVAPTLESSQNASITGVQLQSPVNGSAPVFVLTGAGTTMLRYGESVRIRYYIRSSIEDAQTDPASATFPTLAQIERHSSESGGNGLDPRISVQEENRVRVDYYNSCGQASNDTNVANVLLRVADLDITIEQQTPNTENYVHLMSGDTQKTFVFTIRNNGVAGSVASNITLDLPALGSGWQVDSVQLTRAGTGGSAVPLSATLVGGVWTINPSAVGTLSSGSYATVTARLTYDEDASNGPLTLIMRARGQRLGKDGATPYGYYSYDLRGQRTLGVKIDLERIGTSEVDSGEHNVLVGEEISWRIRAMFRGGSGDVTNLVIRDQMRKSVTANTTTNSFGYVSSSVSAIPNAMTVTRTTSTPAGLLTNPVQTGILNFEIATLTPAAMASGQFFEATVVTRVMNIASNKTTEAQLLHRVGMQFTYQGISYRPTDAGRMDFTGGLTNDVLAKSSPVTVRQPKLRITKLARKVTPDNSEVFKTEEEGNPVTGEAGDVIEYLLIVTNDAVSNDGVARPLYWVKVEDTVHANMTLLATGAGGTTEADNVVVVPNTAGLTPATGKAEFNLTNTPLPTAGENLARLDAGKSVRLLYRARIAQSAHPSQSLSSIAKATGNSLPGDAANDNHSAHPGVLNATNGAFSLEALATGPVVRIHRISHGKSAVAFSAHGASATEVFIGEQIRYRIRVEIPRGTVENFEVIDYLPASLALLDASVVRIGSGISGGAPTITPAVLPASGGSGELQIKWSFGQRVADIDAETEDRTVEIEYLTQVRNIPANIRGLEVKNRAEYKFNNLPEGVVQLEEVSVVIAEPAVAVTKTVDATDGVVSGSKLTYTVGITNRVIANAATAYDLNIVNRLPVGVTYVANSATGASMTEPQVSGDSATGQILTWGRTRSDAPDNIDLGVGETITFTFEVTVDNTSTPGQSYLSEIGVDWTSLDASPGPTLEPLLPVLIPGSEYGERIGDTNVAHNSYHGSASASVNARNNTTIVKTHSGETLPVDAAGTPAPVLTAVRIGDIVTYTLTLSVQEATLGEFKVKDTLPAGFALASAATITPVTGTDGFTYVTPDAANATAPAIGATGEIVWDFGTMVNAGDGITTNDTLTIVYSARVTDTPANPVPQVSGTTNLARVNAALVSYLKADATAHQSETASSEISVSQPRLEVVKTVIDPAGEKFLRPGESGKFRIAVRNSGTAPAYNLQMLDTIPVGMRVAGPQLTLATLNGTSVLAQMQSAPQSVWDQASGSYRFILPTDMIILPGESLVLEYSFILDVDAVKGEELINEVLVELYYGKPATDTEHRREYRDMVSATASVFVALEIHGNVYNDIEPNGHRDAFENWSTGAPVFVNLVDKASGAVVRSVAVPAGNGNYAIKNIRRGTYDVIVALTNTATTASAPLSWLFRMPENGTRTFTLHSSDRSGEDFGLYQGRGIFGSVFVDNGSGAQANNGRRHSSETGISSVTVRLLHGGTLAVLDEVQTQPDGGFSLYLPAGIAAGTPLIVEKVNPYGYVSTGAYLGGHTGSYDRQSDRISLSLNVSAVAGIELGVVPESKFIGEGAQTIMPGASAHYRHTFVAGTAGVVTFTTTSVANPSTPWTQGILLDVNCNGSTEGATAIGSVAIPVAAGETICLIVRDSSPVGSPYGAQNRVQVKATFVHANSSPTTIEELVREDVTTVSQTNAAGLQLTKTVDRAKALPGDDLVYVIVFRNAGSEPLKKIVIEDRTPAYTTLLKIEPPLANKLPAGLTVKMPIIAPAVGSAGEIRWEFDGELLPGDRGEVEFHVRVQD